MGTTKIKLNVTDTKEVIPINSSSVDDYESLPDVFPTEESWINTVNSVFNIPSSATKTLKGEVFAELEKLFVDILMSDNKEAINESKVIIDTARMKLQIVKRDKHIG